MEQTGIVLKTEGKKAFVKITRSTACGEHCGSCSLCEDREITRWVQNPINASRGHIVKIEQDAGSLLTMAFVAYILPIIIAVAATVILQKFLPGGAKADIISFLILILAVLGIAKVGGKMFSGNRFQSRVTEIIGNIENEQI